MSHLDRISIASRVFCLAAVLGLGLVTRDERTLISLVAIATVSSAAVYVSLVTTLSGAWVVTAEALIAGLVIGLTLPTGVALLPYLVVLSLIAGMSRGLAGLAIVTAAELCGAVLLPAMLSQMRLYDALAEIVASWMLTSVGAGLLGAWLKQIGRVARRSEVDSSYESARRLLGQLRTVARRLSAGLDPISMASQVLAAVHETIADSISAVFVCADSGGLSPLFYQGDSSAEVLLPANPLVDACWAEMEPCHAPDDGGGTSSGYLCALPLRVGARMIGVVLARSTSLPAPEKLLELMRELDQHSLRLDTALAFDEVRSIATVEERRRLAREIHDGVAQEVASLGYLVDDLAATAESKTQQAKLVDLRTELTRVVSELRLSIFDLRSEVVRGTTLGAALSEYVHQVGTRSELTVHLTLDEAPTRLRTEVEAELFRIAQEAITNARKHSGARNLWVDCKVQPPFARLEVRDDGTGLGHGREDSYGLRIMKERAQRVDASLEVHNRDSRSPLPGTIVRVTLGEDLPSPVYSEVSS